MIHPCRTDAASEPRHRGLENTMSQVFSKALFESATCGRCGGSGNYSYNMMHGTRCYGCSGRGYVLTKRGRAAQNFLNDLRIKPVEDIKVGDLVYVDFFGGPRGFLDGTIEKALQGCSLVVCRHSNVAVDAIIAGVPVVCYDGAANAIYNSELTKIVEPVAEPIRLKFLRNLAWWQWRDSEIRSGEMWKWMRTMA